MFELNFFRPPKTASSFILYEVQTSKRGINGFTTIDKESLRYLYHIKQLLQHFFNSFIHILF